MKSPMLRMPVCIVLASMAAGALGVGILDWRRSAPAPGGPPEMAREFVFDSNADQIFADYRARIDAVLKCLPPDASPLDKLRALLPLYQDEYQWFLMYEGVLASGVLYGRSMNREIWGQVRARHEYGVAMSTLEVFELGDIVHNTQWITQASVDRVVQKLPRVHAMRRLMTRDLLEKGLKTVLKRENLDQIYPADNAAAAEKPGN